MRIIKKKHVIWKLKRFKIQCKNKTDNKLDILWGQKERKKERKENSFRFNQMFSSVEKSAGREL